MIRPYHTISGYALPDTDGAEPLPVVIQEYEQENIIPKFWQYKFDDNIPQGSVYLYTESLISLRHLINYFYDLP